MKRTPQFSLAKTLLEDVLRDTGHDWLTEYQFAPPRKWAYDYFCPDLALAVEVEGLNGRHQYIGGFLKDMEKYNQSAIRGHSLLRFTWRQVWKGEAEATLRAWKKART